MATDISLFLREEFLKTGCIELECAGYEQVKREDCERLDREEDDSNLFITIHRNTGKPLLISLEEFRDEAEYAMKMLREYTLPWTFTLQQLDIKEMRLEDVLYAVWEKYNGMKMEWE